VVSIRSDELVSDLAKYGVVERKSLTLLWPDVIPNELCNHFVRGYFDGDGCWTLRSSGNLRFNLCGTKRFLEVAQSKFISYCGVTKTKIHASGKMYGLDYTGKNASAIGSWLYGRGGPCLARKRTLWNDYHSRRAS
jgi:hypothetical protein